MGNRDIHALPDLNVFWNDGGLMQGSIHAVEIVFLLLLLFVVVFGVLSQKLKTPYPIVLVLGGLLLSFVPGIPKITLNPDVIFFVILPPLLYTAAWLTSWREFSYTLVSILLLAFGLVTFTVLGVTQAGEWFLPGFDWRVGLVLGAVVAPTDAIAATSIAKRVGLPKRVVDILEGESLLNDATALLALEFGIALLVGGRTPAFTSGLLRLAYLTTLGIVVGLLIGLQLPYVLGTIRDHNLRTLLVYGAFFSAFLILLRLMWMFPGAYVANVIRRRILRQNERLPQARQIFVVGWTGMRGVISLAA